MDCTVHGVAKSRTQLSDFQKALVYQKKKTKTNFYKTTVSQITNKDLLYSTQNATQYSVKAYMEKESKKDWL